MAKQRRCIYIDDELWARIKEAAKLEKRTIGQYIRINLETCVERDEILGALGPRRRE
jgi:hypothetical protein